MNFIPNETLDRSDRGVRQARRVELREDDVGRARFIEAAQGDAFLVVEAQADEHQFTHGGGGSRMRGLDLPSDSTGLENPLAPSLIAAAMRAWMVVVPRERAEDIRRTLLERGVLLKQARIAHEGDSILLPTRERVDLGFPTKEGEFEEGFVAVRSYKDVIEVPPSARRLLPSSFDVVGDIAVIKIPEELREHRMAIGDAIRRWNPKIGVVLEDRGVKGEHRIREIDVIGGEPRTTTVHTEHGLHYRVDLSRAYFSPRLASERKRIADLIDAGETVADPFAGVGPYSILIAKRRRPSEVHASDANPKAVRFLRENVAANRADHVTVRRGDAHAILRQVAPVDRVILDLPHSAMDYLGAAFRALGARGTVHVYGILEEAEEGEARDRIQSAARTAGFRMKGLSQHHVRAYSPTKYQTAFDVTVVRG